VQDTQSWPRVIRRASVNSFGFGGANGHAILESIESYLGTSIPNLVSNVHKRGSALIPVSAGSKKALEARIAHVSQTVQACMGNKAAFDNLVFTLAERRSHHKVRSYLLATVRADGTGAEVSQPSPVDSKVEAVEILPFAFVCTGQGAQYPGMARELLQSNSTFAATIQRLDSILQALPKPPSWTLEETILDPTEADKVHQVTRSQPLCTAIQIALIELLRHWGVQPLYTVGHSSGEIAAAYAAGLLTPAQAILTAYYRGYAVGQLASTGRMLAVGSSSEDANSLIQEKGLIEEVRVAGVNSPTSVTCKYDHLLPI
jgi:acyl transferase domain-containing protein